MCASLMLIALGLISDYSTRTILEQSRSSANIMSQTTDQFLRNAELIRAMGVMDHTISRWETYRRRATTYFMQSGDRIATLSAAARVLRLGVQVALTGVGVLRPKAGCHFRRSVCIDTAARPSTCSARKLHYGIQSPRRSPQRIPSYRRGAERPARNIV